MQFSETPAKISEIPFKLFKFNFQEFFIVIKSTI